jgi:hypothetical protein
MSLVKTSLDTTSSSQAAFDILAYQNERNNLDQSLSQIIARLDTHLDLILPKMWTPKLLAMCAYPPLQKHTNDK